jgi:hypothetical protein
MLPWPRVQKKFGNARRCPLNPKPIKSRVYCMYWTVLHKKSPKSLKPPPAMKGSTYPNLASIQAQHQKYYITSISYWYIHFKLLRCNYQHDVYTMLCKMTPNRTQPASNGKINADTKNTDQLMNKKDTWKLYAVPCLLTLAGDQPSHPNKISRNK